jgi:hypothetical protein
LQKSRRFNRQPNQIIGSDMFSKEYLAKYSENDSRSPPGNTTHLRQIVKWIHVGVQYCVVYTYVVAWKHRKGSVEKKDVNARDKRWQYIIVKADESGQFEVIVHSCSTEATEIFKHQTALFWIVLIVYWPQLLRNLRKVVFVSLYTPCRKR